MTNTQSESQLLYSTMQELGKHGAVYRCNSGQFKLSNGKWFRGMPKGFSDILFIRTDGKACFIECKVGYNKPSPEQTAFIERMRALGAYAGAYSVDEAMAICGINAAAGV